MNALTRKAAIVAAALALMSAGAVHAQTAAAKVAVDAAKAAGQVGEQADGFLGLLSTDAPPAVRAAVTEINEGRAAVFRDAAAKAGTTADAAGVSAARTIFERIPAGHYYQNADGRWLRK